MNKIAIIYIHGIQSHSGWTTETKEWFEEKGIYFHTPNRIGSGLSTSKRGHINSYAEWISDINDQIKYVMDTVNPDRIFLMGLCWGAKVVLAHSIIHPKSPINGLILLTPGLVTKISISFWDKLKLIGSWLCKNDKKYFDLPLKYDMFTEDPDYLQFIKNDIYKLEEVTSGFLKESRKLDKLVFKNITKIKLPILSFFAEKDPIVNNNAVINLLNKIYSEIIIYPDTLHSIEFSGYGEMMLNKTKTWIEEMTKEGLNETFNI